MIITKSEILDKEDVQIEKLEIPEWDTEICIRTISSFQKDHFESSLIDTRTGSQRRYFQNIRARFAVLVICDESGTLIFDESDINSLGHKSGSALDRIWDAARKLNRFSDEDIEELRGNSKGDQNDS